MRRHQDLPAHGRRLPLWRLVGGELVWAGRQLATERWALVGLFGGFAATFSVLSTAAPGPIVDPPWRMLTASVVGLLIAAGVRGLRLRANSAGHKATRRRAADTRPLIGATVISGALAVVLLISWMIVWLVEHTTQ